MSADQKPNQRPELAALDETGIVRGELDLGLSEGDEATRDAKSA